MEWHIRSELLIAISIVAIAIITVLLFDSPIPFFIICLIAILIVAVYVTVPVLMPEKRHLKKPIVFEQNVLDSSQIHIEVSRFSSDNNKIMLMLNGATIAKLFRGSSVDLHLPNGVHELIIESLYGKMSVTVDIGVDRTVYIWFDKDLTYHIEAVTPELLSEYESVNQKEYQKYCTKMKKKLPFIIGIQIIVAVLVILYIIKYI